MTRCFVLAACHIGVAAAVGLAAPTAANPGPGIEIEDDNGSCTAGFAAQDDQGNYYLLTSGHCDSGDGSRWTDAGDGPLGQITASDYDGDEHDAAILRLDPGSGPPSGAIAGRYPVRDVLRPDQILIGTPLCKIGATTGETCGPVTAVDAFMVRAGVFSLTGDSGSPAFVKNPDGTVSAVGILAGSPEGDDYTTYFTLVDPVLQQWGLRIVP